MATEAVHFPRLRVEKSRALRFSIVFDALLFSSSLRSPISTSSVAVSLQVFKDSRLDVLSISSSGVQWRLLIYVVLLVIVGLFLRFKPGREVLFRGAVGIYWKVCQATGFSLNGLACLQWRFTFFRV
ncbi:unnamed protein product [Citrullus colocynthis]|uniref:Uncharacterized protein n=1 Tax=Citrullus colocynthis TaxID=252529 RepID=A0ABP0YG22_9ROSI